MDHAVKHNPNGAGHEESEVNVTVIVVSLAALLVGVILTAFLSIGIFRYFHTANRTAESANENQPQVPPEPRIEVEPFQQLKGLRAREDHVLSTYAWVDKKEGTVRIPIEQAIDQLVKQGLPSHDYLQDMQAGRKPPAPAKPQGSTNAAK